MATVQESVVEEEGATLLENKLAFPNIVKNAASLFNDTSDEGYTSAHLDYVKATFEGMKNSFLEVRAMASFVTLLGKPNPFANLDKENSDLQRYESEVFKMQGELEKVQQETDREKVNLRATMKDVREAFVTVKRKFAETEQLLKDVNIKRTKFASSTASLVSSGADQHYMGRGDTERTDIKTVDGCKNILTDQTKAMKSLGEEEVSMQEQLVQLEKELAPLKAEMDELKAQLCDGDELEIENSGSSAGETAELTESIVNLEKNKEWFRSVMGLIQDINGVKLDIDEADLEKADSWKQALGDHNMKLRLEDDAHMHTLVIGFNLDSSKIQSAEIEPADIPVEDILLGAQSLSETGDIAYLIREVRVRLRAKRERLKEVEALKQHYPAVRTQYKGSKESPMLFHTLIAHVTLREGIVVVLEMDPDYPQPYAKPDLVELVGVMGWSDEEMLEIAQEVRSKSFNTVGKIVDLVQKIASEKQGEADMNM
jgi:predicted  nucleic acid-binding Zn-ribbon protein